MNNNLTWLYENDEYVNSFAKLMAQVGGHATDGFTAHEWLMAERNDGSAPENGVSDPDGGSNVAYVAQDSREKLEADVMEYYTYTTSTAMWPDSANVKTKWISVPMDKVLGWLDRQAAIAERDAFMRGRASLDDEFADMQEQVDRLERENESLARDLAECERDREVYRMALGDARRLAHEIARIEAGDAS